MGRFSSRRFDSGRLRHSRGIGQGEDDEDHVLRERGPGLAKTCKPRVNRRQMLPIGVRVARLRRCQAALRKSQTLAKKATCGTRVSGSIPAARSAPAWRAGSLAVLDRRAAELKRFPSLWRSARRSHRPKPFTRWTAIVGLMGVTSKSVRLPVQRTKPLRGGPKATVRDGTQGSPCSLSPFRYSPRFPSLGTPVLTAPVQTRLRCSIMETADGLPVRASHRERSWP